MFPLGPTYSLFTVVTQNFNIKFELQMIIKLLLLLIIIIINNYLIIIKIIKILKFELQMIIKLQIYFHRYIIYNLNPRK